MSAEKTELSRAGTMQATAKEGKNFLKKNLTEWKKPYLIDEKQEEGNSAEEAPEEAAGTSTKKAKMSKHSTMKGTAKEAEVILEASGKPDEDAFTRGQQKQIEEIQAEKPAARKARMGRASTMAGTAKEGKDLLGSEKLGDTRGETKNKKAKGSVARSTTIDKVTAEAKLIYGDLPKSEGRSMRKRAAPPPTKAPLKKKGTMVVTAKEGKAFVKKQNRKGKKAPPKVEKKEEEEEDGADEDAVSE